MSLKLFKKQKGVGLVEAISAIGIVSIIIYIMAGVFTNQHKETKAVSDTLAKLDLEKLLISALSDGKICTKVLSGKQFSTSTNNWTTPLALTSLPASDMPSAPNLIEVDGLVSPSSASLLVESIDYISIINNGSDNTSTNYRTTLQVSLKNSVRPLRPILLQTILVTDNNVTTKTVASCIGAGSGLAGSQNYIPKWLTDTQLGLSNVYEDATGRLGVGTVTPTSQLSVISTVLANLGRFDLFNAATPSDISYDGGIDGSFEFFNLGVATGDTKFSSIAKSGIMTVKNTGRVGLGTINPAGQLSVQGDGATGGEIIAGQGWDGSGFQKGVFASYSETLGKYQVLDLVGKDIRIVPASDNTGTGNGPVALFARNTDGFIGVGTQSPAANMHIFKSGAPVRLVLHNPEEQSTYLEFAGTGGVGGAEGFEIEYRNNAGDTYLRNRFLSGGFGNIYFQTNTATSPYNSLTLTGTGRAGVGTATPQVEFHVKATDTVNGNADIALESTAGYKWTLSSENGGNFVINRDIPGTFAAITINQSGGVSTPSDLRLKEEVRELGPNEMELFNLLRPVSFKWNEAVSKNSDLQMGFIAQEVEKLFPFLITQGNDDRKTKSLNYLGLVAPAVAAIQQNSQEIEKLKQENKELKQILCEIKPEAKLCTDL